MAAPTRIQVAANIGATGSATGNQSVAASSLNLAQTGDLLVWCSAGRGTVTAPPASGTGGQTWTQVFDGTGNPRAFSMFRATFNGTWSGDPTSTNAPGTTTIEISVWRATNTGVTWSHEIVGGPTGVAASATNTMTGGTPSGSDPVVVIGYVQTADDNSYGNLTGSGWDWIGSTTGYANSGGSDNSLATVYRADAAATATGSPTIDQTANGNDAYTNAVVAFKAAGGTPPPAADKIEDLVEDFSGGSLPASFADDSVGGTVTVTGGQLVLDANSGNTAAVQTPDPYDLTASSIYWQMTASGTNGTTSGFILGNAGFLNGYAVEFDPDSGTSITVRRLSDASSLYSATYNSTTHRHWRMVESAGDVEIDSSTDGSSWTNRAIETIASDQPTFDIGNVYVRCYASFGDLVLAVDGINTPLSSTVTADAHPDRISVRTVPAAAALGALTRQANPNRISYRTVAAAVVLGAITAPSVPNRVAVRTTTATSTQALTTTATPDRLTLRTTTASVNISASGVSVPVVLSYRTVPASVTLGTVNAPAKPNRLAVATTPAIGFGGDATFADAPPTALGLRTTVASGSVGTVTPPATPNAFHYRTVPASVVLGDLAAPSHANRLDFGTTTAETTNAHLVNATPSRLVYRTVPASVSIGAIAAVAKPNRLSVRTLSAGQATGGILASSPPSRITLRSVSATVPGAVPVTALANRVRYRTTVASVTVAEPIVRWPLIRTVTILDQRNTVEIPDPRRSVEIVRPLYTVEIVE